MWASFRLSYDMIPCLHAWRRLLFLRKNISSKTFSWKQPPRCSWNYWRKYFQSLSLSAYSKRHAFLISPIASTKMGDDCYTKQLRWTQFDKRKMNNDQSDLIIKLDNIVIVRVCFLGRSPHHTCNIHRFLFSDSHLYIYIYTLQVYTLFITAANTNPTYFETGYSRSRFKNTQNSRV